MSPEFYLVIDFEATCCDRGEIPRQSMEIIEIGAVMVQASNFQIVSEYQSFVRPVRNPELTVFCTNLTSIRQSDVDSAPLFVDFVSSFKSWLSSYEDFIFCSWGDYDLKQLQQDCNFHEVPYPISSGHVNAKRLMAERHLLRKKPGLSDAVRLVGLEFVGTHHRGIDDARNIARLLPYIFGNLRR